MESHGVPSLYEEGTPNPLPSSKGTTVESRKGSKALGPTKWGRNSSPARSKAGYVSAPLGANRQGFYEKVLPVLSRWTFHRLE